ncbi:hypothetical protein [Nocardia sp. NPDC049149]|uniref:hypothetical protein n=1 Tax=Nocardia sp. NPDC049149 TaxID=3364315 RepID=UPI00371BE3DD
MVQVAQSQVARGISAPLIDFGQTHVFPCATQVQLSLCPRFIGPPDGARGQFGRVRYAADLHQVVGQAGCQSGEFPTQTPELGLHIRRIQATHGRQSVTQTVRTNQHVECVEFRIDSRGHVEGLSGFVVSESGSRHPFLVRGNGSRQRTDPNPLVDRHRVILDSRGQLFE